MRALLCVLALAPMMAAAQAPSWQSPDSVRAAAEALARRQLAAPGETLAVRAVVDDQLRLPACKGPLQTLVHRNAGQTLTAAVACTAPSAWSIYVPVRVSRQAAVLVLTRALLAGEAVTADAVASRMRDVAELPYGHFASLEAALGQTARRALAAGTALSPQDVAAPRLVKRGQPVVLVTRAGALLVRADGQALNDGAVGDYIAVQNTQTRRQVRGRVRSGQEVEVDL